MNKKFIYNHKKHLHLVLISSTIFFAFIVGVFIIILKYGKYLIENGYIVKKNSSEKNIVYTEGFSENENDDAIFFKKVVDQNKNCGIFQPLSKNSLSKNSLSKNNENNNFLPNREPCPFGSWVFAPTHYISNSEKMENFYGSPEYSHSVDIPLTTTYSCKNMCSSQSKCYLTGGNCTSDIDCYGCNPFTQKM